MNSVQGQFLVASPNLGDGNFFRSVVYMVQHDDEGALGLILNRPVSQVLSDVLEDTEEFSAGAHSPIYHGGTVPGPLIALHTDVTCSEDEIMPGLYFSAQPFQIRKLAAQNQHPFRVFYGYSGWCGGQLEQETEVGSWLTAPAKIDEIFYDGEDLWKRLTQRIGVSILGPTLKSCPVPDDPSMN